jgi:WD40 repeat protein
MQLDGHSDAIRSVVLTNQGRFVVTASDDCTVRVWDTQAPNLHKTEQHDGRVKQVWTGSHLYIELWETVPCC